MSLEMIVSTILEDAEVKASEIKRKASEAASSITGEAQRQAEGLSWGIIKQAEQKTALEQKRFEVNQTIEYKKAVLGMKQKLIDGVFRKAKGQLAGLGQKEYTALLEAMLINFIETGDETLLISKEDKARIDEKFLNSISRDIAGPGKYGKLKMKVDETLKNNTFILETKNTRRDIGFDAVLAVLREEITGEAAKVLFRGEK